MCKCFVLISNYFLTDGYGRQSSMNAYYGNYELDGMERSEPKYVGRQNLNLTATKSPKITKNLSVASPEGANSLNDSVFTATPPSAQLSQSQKPLTQENRQLSNVKLDASKRNKVKFYL